MLLDHSPTDNSCHCNRTGGTAETATPWVNSNTVCIDDVTVIEEKSMLESPEKNSNLTI